MQQDHYKIVSDEDGRWYVTDGDVIVNDSPFHSRDAAIDRRDELNLKMWELLGSTAEAL